MAYNPFSLEKKTILVTGASSGIGRGIAVECSKMGGRVVVSGRNKERLNETLLLLEGTGHLAIQADLSKQDEIDSLVENCPVINGCVHSAGIPKICGVKYINRVLLEEIVNINEIAPILLTSSLLKKKKLSKEASIVFIASMSGVYIANIGEAPYSTTKGALSGFVKGAALELAAQGTRVNTICPGLVPTSILGLSNEMFSEEQLKETMYGRYPLKRVGTPEDIANGAIYLLSDASSWVTGINLLVDGGYCLA
ncbi:3-oxoacyl-ACP reductase [Odoribacteraceae bacterium]|uniref:SDR family NAD(P)-dependent oxidoreductase n=1 Tax=Butyricimonas paravirosa TaxID=1472417 RepID=UPI00208ACC29|nr:SDR family oxidoreductase [Butyricimonas paravirosa]GKH98947.1 3-oxoacyl-ACP reductase [Odoribacteraceae bacterium]GKI02412.1 3-oxoacyl-ACP reductase [Odoribacteraceae bacterium]